MSIKWGCADSTDNKKTSSLAWIVLALLLVYAVLQTIIPTVFGQASASIKPTYIKYVVEDGDTLHDIARRLYPDRDWREVAWEIEQVNDTTALIYPGQIIWVPLQ